MSGERLAGRTVAVVGAGSRQSPTARSEIGNGRAIAMVAAREGAMVLCGDRDADALDRTVSLIANDGGRAAGRVVDVTAEDSCGDFATWAGSEGMDGLVLNVGIAKGMGLEGTGAKEWDLTMAANLRGHFLTVRAAMPLLPDRSAIVFVSSLAGSRPGTRIPAYDASKAGLAGLCRHVALEGAHRAVRANAVELGMIDTPVGQAAAHGRPDRADTPLPMGRQGTPWEVATAVAFLLSDDASYITGQILGVDGGLALLGLAQPHLAG